MRVFKYWAKYEGDIRVGSETHKVTCVGGSNDSESCARDAAREKLRRVQDHILGKPHVFDDYEVEIKEEIIRVLDDNNIITRNRYGAEVLNSSNVMMIDIDEPPRGVMDLFRRLDTQQKKARIIAMVEKRSEKYARDGLGFRVYETAKGIRVIVLGGSFDPESRASKNLLKDMNTDRLYAFLCVRQKCYRARLSPKPSRIKCKARKFKVPYAQDEREEIERWKDAYYKKSRGFSVCKYIATFGKDALSSGIVETHDGMTGAHQSLTLA
ncbi:MAG: hypothetical protein WC450_05635 [Candidatus Omnitrophota bacterium]|jgi:hypothetical protein